LAEWDEKAIFLAALKLDPDGRTAFVAQVCPDASRRARIEELLRAHADGTKSLFRDAVDASPSAEDEPQRIDEFQIISHLGEGGMGVVYLAQDTVLGRRVALKVLAPRLASSRQALGRFQQEARSAATLNHPSIVPVYKFGFDGVRHYIASEFVAGPTLEHRLEEERVRRLTDTAIAQVRSWPRYAAEVIAAIADALDYAHRQKIIHRDVKPSNILIDPDRGPRLTDFGIAKYLADDHGAEKTGLIGSCHYMSPEQASLVKSPVDQRSDVFSLGVVLYEMLALRRPFEGTNQNEVLKNVLETEPISIRAIDRWIPRDLAVICHKALEKQPTNRYQSAAHIAADLRSFLSGNPILARPPSIMHTTARLMWRVRMPIMALSLFAFMGLTLWLISLVRASYLDSFAWLDAEAIGTACHVYAQRVDDISLLPGEPIALGATPVRVGLLPPGVYRVTVQAENDVFSEFNLVLRSPGKLHRRLLRVHKDGPTPSQAWSDAQCDSAKLKSTFVVASEGMVYVEPGAYVFGWSSDQNPLIHERTVSLPGFYIDANKVSNREFKEFVDATGYSIPPQWRVGGSYDDSIADRPVVTVSWADAEAYARWKGKRLPTALEWEAAACGRGNDRYPWGNSQTDTVSSIEPPAVDIVMKETDDHAILDNLYRKWTIDTREPHPLMDRGKLRQIFGNVAELTSTISFARDVLVTKGRSWSESPRSVTLKQIATHSVGRSSFELGFRCARSVQPVFTPSTRSDHEYRKE
jgi:serine/threonine protein kinase/formylglycine-generating enzyme required for sulfatase activity